MQVVVKRCAWAIARRASRVREAGFERPGGDREGGKREMIRSDEGRVPPRRWSAPAVVERFALLAGLKRDERPRCCSWPSVTPTGRSPSGRAGPIRRSTAASPRGGRRCGGGYPRANGEQRSSSIARVTSLSNRFYHWIRHPSAHSLAGEERTVGDSNICGVISTACS